jgi:hypothetical protein
MLAHVLSNSWAICRLSQSGEEMIPTYLTRVLSSVRLSEIAQLAERLTVNQNVVGSSPTLGAISICSSAVLCSQRERDVSADAIWVLFVVAP